MKWNKSTYLTTTYISPQRHRDPGERTSKAFMKLHLRSLTSRSGPLTCVRVLSRDGRENTGDRRPQWGRTAESLHGAGSRQNEERENGMLRQARSKAVSLAEFTRLWRAGEKRPREIVPH
jgi:hypothetical protein